MRPGGGIGAFPGFSVKRDHFDKKRAKNFAGRQGKTLTDYQVEVVNDELVITDDDGELFQYNPERITKAAACRRRCSTKSKRSLRIACLVWI